MRNIYFLIIFLSILLMDSCSHKFDSNTLGLEFYQWNLWHDSEAEPGDDLPSCGWEDFHRGKGKLVRIPAALDQHFPDLETSGVFWYHCRFTLPEQWEDKPIVMVFKEAGPSVKVFLNEELVGSFQAEQGACELDVSTSIFYTRDNHLSIRISKVRSGAATKQNGITGTILVKSGA